VTDQARFLELTADVVVSHVANNTVAISDVPNLIKKVHEALQAIETQPLQGAELKKGIVSIRASVKPDYLACLACGAKQKTLKRHLQVAHGMAPDQYRADYGLPRTYPMVAASYAQRRSELAKSFGLGRKGTGRTAQGKSRR
jgi:predicted transcriptional regulator